MQRQLFASMRSECEGNVIPLRRIVRESRRSVNRAWPAEGGVISGRPDGLGRNSLCRRRQALIGALIAVDDERAASGTVECAPPLRPPEGFPSPPLRRLPHTDESVHDKQSNPRHSASYIRHRSGKFVPFSHVNTVPQSRV